MFFNHEFFHPLLAHERDLKLTIETLKSMQFDAHPIVYTADDRTIGERRADWEGDRAAAVAALEAALKLVQAALY
jgi:hypothetical protein